MTESQPHRRYKRLALQRHPDMEKGTDAEFVAVGLAYHVLSSNKLRAQYDANEQEFANSRALLVDTFDMPKVSLRLPTSHTRRPRLPQMPPSIIT